MAPAHIFMIEAVVIILGSMASSPSIRGVEPWVMNSNGCMSCGGSTVRDYQ